MNDEVKNENTATTAPALHPLLAAFHDMAKVATTQRGLKALARIQHGIALREKWIASRETQIEALNRLSAEVLNAYDNGDDRHMAQIMREVEQIVQMSEGVSAAETRIGEVFDADVEDDGIPFPAADKLPFRQRNRK